jgi:hypothetical protein
MLTHERVSALQLVPDSELSPVPAQNYKFVIIISLIIRSSVMRSGWFWGERISFICARGPDSPHQPLSPHQCSCNNKFSPTFPPFISSLLRPPLHFIIILTHPIIIGLSPGWRPCIMSLLLLWCSVLSVCRRTYRPESDFKRRWGNEFLLKQQWLALFCTTLYSGIVCQVRLSPERQIRIHSLVSCEMWVWILLYLYYVCTRICTICIAFIQHAGRDMRLEMMMRWHDRCEMWMWNVNGNGNWKFRYSISHPREYRYNYRHHISVILWWHNRDRRDPTFWVRVRVPERKCWQRQHAIEIIKLKARLSCQVASLWLPNHMYDGWWYSYDIWYC